MESAVEKGSSKRRRRDARLPVLYLDYDGVLHPDEVYRVGDKIVLRMDGFALFEWCSILETLLAPYPELQIVLSSSWVRVVGFDDALARLPDRIRRRVVGATWHMQGPRRWAGRTRTIANSYAERCYSQSSGSVRRRRFQPLAAEGGPVARQSEGTALVYLCAALGGRTRSPARFGRGSLWVFVFRWVRWRLDAQSFVQPGVEDVGMPVDAPADIRGFDDGAV